MSLIVSESEKDPVSASALQGFIILCFLDAFAPLGANSFVMSPSAARGVDDEEAEDGGDGIGKAGAEEATCGHDRPKHGQPLPEKSDVNRSGLHTFLNLLLGSELIELFSSDSPALDPCTFGIGGCITIRWRLRTCRYAKVAPHCGQLKGFKPK